MKPTKVMYYGKKFKNKIVEYDGMIFDSEKEKFRYINLINKQANGVISNLRRQVPFDLKTCTYIADFTYYDRTGNFIVEDVKGGLNIIKNKNKTFNPRKTTITKEFLKKKRLMEELYGIEIKIFIN